jgi:hypothetical protein
MEFIKKIDSELGVAKCPKCKMSVVVTFSKANCQCGWSTDIKPVDVPENISNRYNNIQNNYPI